MRGKLISYFGAFGGILYFVLLLLVAVFPIMMIETNLFLNFLFIVIIDLIPITSIVFWIWGLFKAISGPQDVFAIVYYVLFVILFAPVFLVLLIDFVNGIVRIIKRK